MQELRGGFLGTQQELMRVENWVQLLEDDWEERLDLLLHRLPVSPRRNLLSWNLAGRGLSCEGCPGKWHVCNPCCHCTMQQLQPDWFRSFAPPLASSSRGSGLLTMPDTPHLGIGTTCGHGTAMTGSPKNVNA